MSRRLNHHDDAPKRRKREPRRPSTAVASLVLWHYFRYRGIADMGGHAAGPTLQQLTQRGHQAAIIRSQLPFPTIAGFERQAAASHNQLKSASHKSSLILMDHSASGPSFI